MPCSDAWIPLQAPASRRVTPQPSPSQLAMEERGLERVAPRLVKTPRIQSPMDRSVQSTPVDANKPLPLEPENDVGQKSALARTKMQGTIRRSPSVYSHSSTRSIDSADSLGTTISQIIELYTGLASAWSDDEVPMSAVDPDLPILQPQAYRDTIAPLLQRRYSFERSNSSPPILPQIPTEPLYLMPVQDAADTALIPSRIHDDQRAPTFQEFSRNLQDVRSEMISPLSNHSVSLQAHVAEISPLNTPQPQVNSVTFGNFEAKVSQTQFDLDRSNSILQQATIRGVSQESQHDILGRPGPTIRVPPSKLPAAIQQRKQTEESSVLSNTYLVQPKRYCERPMSAESDSTDSFVIYTGMTDTIKGRFKKQIKKRKAVKDRKEVMRAAAQKYPGMTSHPQNHDFSLTEARRVSVEGFNAVMRRLSLASSADDPIIYSEGMVGPQAAVLLSEYQKHGAQIWTAEAKKKRKEQRRLQKMSQDSQHSQYSQRTIRSCNHMRSKSQQSTGTLGSSRGEQWGVMRGLKNSLGRSASQRRREKLKASIVVIGPTSITAKQHAFHDG